jgi:hypothetical protein
MSISDFSHAQQKHEARARVQREEQQRVRNQEDAAARLIGVGLTSAQLSPLLRLTNDQIRVLRDVLSDVIARVEGDAS